MDGGPHDGVGFVVAELSPYVEFQTEEAIAEVVAGRDEELVADVVAFSHDDAAQVRADHAAFVDAFRAGMIRGVQPGQVTGEVSPHSRACICTAPFPVLS